MAFMHGKTTLIKVATKDLSAYTRTSTLEITSDVHDTTGYGATAHTKQAGLTDGAFTMGGTYDTTASTGPRAALESLVGTTVAVIRQPEGAGTTKPQDVFSAVLKKYTETNPVDGMITWSAEMEITGVNVTTPQP